MCTCTCVSLYTQEDISPPVQSGLFYVGIAWQVYMHSLLSSFSNYPAAGQASNINCKHALWLCTAHFAVLGIDTCDEPQTHLNKNKAENQVLYISLYRATSWLHFNFHLRAFYSCTWSYHIECDHMRSYSIFSLCCQGLHFYHVYYVHRSSTDWGFRCIDDQQSLIMKCIFYM